MLRKDALAQFALAAKNSPAASLIYADHDFFSHKRTRCKPVFKPDWNYDLFLTHDYIASPCAFASRTCSKYHLNPVELTSSEHRYDLILLVAKTSPEEIIHIPGVLLHRLAEDPNPTGADPAPISPLLRHLSSHGATATLGSLPQTHRIRWPLPTSPLVSILIATRDHSQILRKCITSIQRLTTYPHWEIVLIDNQSSDPDCLSYLKQLNDTQNIRVIPYNFPFNYSAIQNFGVSQCRGEVIAFMNNDIEIISPTWLEDLVRQAIRPEVGAVGAKLLYSDGRVQHAGVALGIGGVAGHLHRYSPGDSPGYCGRLQLAHQLTAVTAACLVIKKYTFESVGGFNEKHLKIALNDVDLCLKLHRLGLKNIYEPAAVLYHHESLSRGPDDTLAKRRVFLQEREWMLAQWPDLIARDPHYNPNLTLEHEDFSVTTHRPGASRPAAKRGW
jgi:GT2 family glycosyltransferase